MGGGGVEVTLNSRNVREKGGGNLYKGVWKGFNCDALNTFYL